jgi:tetratricopeptide (TPR) repeat protein
MAMLGCCLAVSLAGVPGAHADALASNAQAWKAFLARDLSATEAAAREAASDAEADGNTRQAGIASANVAAALALRGSFREAREWSDRADERLAASAATKRRGRLAVARAIIEYAGGAREAGRGAFERAAQWLGADDWRLAFARLTIAIYVDPASSDSYQGLVDLLGRARAARDPERTLRCLLALGWAETFFNPASSLERYREASDLAASRGPELRGYAAHDLGVALFRARDLDSAEPVFAEALREARQTGDRRLQVVLLNDLSLLHVQKGEDAPAREEDVAAQGVLALVAEDLRRGRIDDTVLLDFRELSKLRCLNLPPPLYPLFLGLFDQIALDPAEE